MDKKLQDTLYKKYPKVFTQKDLSIKESAMPWGFEFGNGWFRLVDCLCEAIQRHIDGVGDNKILQVEATQVKEKFGGLRFYFTGGDKCIHGMVSFAEDLSYHICEFCGNTGGDVSQTKGHIITLCAECRSRK